MFFLLFFASMLILTAFQCILEYPEQLGPVVDNVDKFPQIEESVL